jgi:hypothetical protein
MGDPPGRMHDTLRRAHGRNLIALTNILKRQSPRIFTIKGHFTEDF